MKMKRMKQFGLWCILGIFLASCTRTDVPKIIFDTDLGNDIDDTEALDLLFKYMDEGRIDLLGICLNKEGDATLKFTDLMENWYGYEDIPVGVIRNAGNTGVNADSCYTGKICRLTNEDGTPLFATKGLEYNKLPDSHLLYRKLLASQPDHSVTIVSVGFLTNIARLLDTPADEYSPLTGKELVAKKVKCLSIMGGRFRDNTPEFNIAINVSASQKIFTEWPVEIVSLPWEMGDAVRYPASSIENDFGWTNAHPLRESYIRYIPMPYDNYMFDPTAVVYAVEGPDMFTSSGSGTISVDDKGVTTFTAEEGGKHSYMSVNEEQAKVLRDYFVRYLTQKPKKYASCQ